MVKRSLVGAVLVSIGLILVHTTAGAVSFSSGDVVEVINTGSSGLIVRGPDACGGNLGENRFDGDCGVVLVDDPVYCNDYYRWKIRWEDGLEGWSAEGYPGGVDYLRKKYISPSTKFSIGNKVGVYNTNILGGLVVRTDPPELARKGKVYDGTTGVVKGGPFYGVPKGSSGFYHFWKVEYDNGVVGWSVEDGLKIALPNQPPTCSLSANPRSGKAPLTVTFTMSASDPDGSISIWGLDVDSSEQAEIKNKIHAYMVAKKVQRKGFQTLRWEASDANGDSILYSIFIKREDEDDWRVLKEGWAEKIFAFDTISFPDGVYFMKIEVSDSPSNPLGMELKADKISRALMIDNSLPVIRNFRAVRDKNKLNVSFSAVDSFSHIREAKFLIRPNEWRTIFPEDGICDSKSENFNFILNLPQKFDNLIAVKVWDSYGNVGVYRTTF